MVLVRTDKGPLRFVLGVAAAFVILPIALVAAIAARLLPQKPIRRTPEQVAAYLKNFLEGAGDAADWDDFTSVAIDDAELDAIRKEAELVMLPADEAGLGRFEALLQRAERLAKSRSI